MAEAWLIAKEPYLLTTHVGNSVDDVEKLLKKHEAFEKSTATWEERFAALERLTTVRPLHDTLKRCTSCLWYGSLRMNGSDN